MYDAILWCHCKNDMRAEIKFVSYHLFRVHFVVEIFMRFAAVVDPDGEVRSVEGERVGDGPHDGDVDLLAFEIHGPPRGAGRAAAVGELHLEEAVFGAGIHRHGKGKVHVDVTVRAVGLGGAVVQGRGEKVAHDHGGVDVVAAGELFEQGRRQRLDGAGAIHEERLVRINAADETILGGRQTVAIKHGRGHTFGQAHRQQNLNETRPCRERHLLRIVSQQMNLRFLLSPFLSCLQSLCLLKKKKKRRYFSKPLSLL